MHMTKIKASGKPGSGKIIRCVIIILLAIAGYGAAVGIYSLTVISPLVPVMVGLAGGAFTGTLFWKYWIPITSSSRFYINFIVNIFVSAGILSALFLGINMWGANRNDLREEKVVVERRFSETHHRSKRVGRRYVTQGEPYKMYYIEIGMPEGKKKKLAVGYSDFRRIRTGDSIMISVNKGLLGFPVVRNCKKSRKPDNH